MKPEQIDFLIIGAAKSATTWLQTMLQADPAVCMPDPELHYFSRNHDRGLAWYLDQFPRDDAHRVVGEKSNSYLDERHAPERVHALLPHSKLIVQLRNPVARAYSDYCMLYRRGEVGRDVEAHLDVRGGVGNRFLRGGLYYDQLRPYLDLFPRDRLMVLFYEDMLRDPAAQIAQVRRFLDLSDEGPDVPVSRKVKDRSEPMLSPELRKLLRPLKPLARPLRNNPLFASAHRLLARETAYPVLPPRLAHGLVEFYARDVDQLGGIVRRDLSGWLRGIPLSTNEGTAIIKN